MEFHQRGPQNQSDGSASGIEYPPLDARGRQGYGKNHGLLYLLSWSSL